MLDIDLMLNILREKLNNKRFEHSLGVQKTAEELARKYGVSVKKASIAGLLHDCAKNYSGEQLFRLALELNITIDDVTRYNPHLLHGQIGARVASDIFSVKDNDILNAIRYHTTGRKNMSSLEKIIYLSDFIEPNRCFPGVDKIRNQALFDLDKATLMALNHTISYVISKGTLLHHATIHARNFLLLQK